MPGPDRIELRGLRALGHHGATAAEQAAAQPFEVDLDLELDLAAAARSDRLGDTVDYGAVVAAVVAVIERERWALLERMAERVAEVAAADPRVRSVTVAVRKLRPPVPHELATAGVRITRAGRAGPPPRRAFLGLGSNLGDRRAHLRRAVAGLPDVVAVSPVYETAPVGGPEGQGPYLNVVVELATTLTARELLGVARVLEDAAGRRRDERWGPRTLDVDVLWIDGERVDEPDLVVPHPRLWQRRFVVAPLADLAPDLVPPDRWEAAAGEVCSLGPLG